MQFPFIVCNSLRWSGWMGRLHSSAGWWRSPALWRPMHTHVSFTQALLTLKCESSEVIFKDMLNWYLNRRWSGVGDSKDKSEISYINISGVPIHKMTIHNFPPTSFLKLIPCSPRNLYIIRNIDAIILLAMADTTLSHRNKRPALIPITQTSTTQMFKLWLIIPYISMIPAMLGQHRRVGLIDSLLW